MTDPVDFNERKKAKAAKCEFCGEPAHAEQLMCPRIVGVIYHEDAVEICFRSDWVPPLAG